MGGPRCLRSHRACGVFLSGEQFLPGGQRRALAASGGECHQPALADRGIGDPQD